MSMNGPTKIKKSKPAGSDKKITKGKTKVCAKKQLGSVAQLPEPNSQTLRLAMTQTYFTTRTQLMPRAIMLF